MTARTVRCWPRLVVPLVVVAALATGCGGKSSSRAGVLGKNIKPLDTSLVPSEVLGLKVTPEDVSQALSVGGRSYIDATAVFSFRKDQLLQSTLQVSRFIDDAKYRKNSFRTSLVSGVGGTIPKLVRLGGDRVYLTAGNQQRLSVWFRGRYLFILATRNDFDQPRTLLRAILDLPIGRSQ